MTNYLDYFTDAEIIWYIKSRRFSFLVSRSDFVMEAKRRGLNKPKTGAKP